MERALSDTLATNVWKLFPFRAGNRMWLVVVLQAYIVCNALAFCLACILNAVEGEEWLKHNRSERITGDSALDEITWYVFTTMHGVGFGEFIARGVVGRLITMFSCSLGYMFGIYLMCIIMLSQLPGEKAPTLCSSSYRLVSALWPSYGVFLSVVLAIGSMVGHYLSRDHEGRNEWPSGMYWAWTVAHRMPYGDVYPDTALGRTVTVPLACMGLLYWPYALACIAVRCPSLAQHRSMVEKLQSEPDDALGPGYFQPPDGTDHVANFDMLGAPKDDEYEREHRCRSSIAVCTMLVLTVFGMIFLGGKQVDAGSTLKETVAKILELNTPPGIRSMKDPMPAVVWMFWMHEYPMETLAKQSADSIEIAVDIPVQIVTPQNLHLWNDTENPFHPAMNHLAPNHKLDYLFAYFMHHYGGAFVHLGPHGSMMLKDNFTWEDPTDFMASNASYHILGSPVQMAPADVPCDESNIQDEWCKEMQFAGDGTYAETQVGLQGWKHSSGPCCPEVLKYYGARANSSIPGRPYLRTDQIVMRKQSDFTREWMALVDQHLGAKYRALIASPPPVEPCCLKEQGTYPIRWDELVGEIWSSLIPKYAEHINVEGRELPLLVPGVAPPPSLLS